MFFDNNGMLDIDGLVMKNESFRKIMEDGVVTEEEVRGQSDKVIAMLHEMETKYDAKQIEEISQLISEFGVLYAVYEQYSIQSIR